MKRLPKLSFKLPIQNLKYCIRCCMPETNEGVQFDEFGQCYACISSEQKIRLDWVQREKELKKLLDHYKSLNNDYDCIVPISGGKDSTFQLHVLTKIYKMRVLAVTFSHNWFTEVGKYNLQNAIEKFDVDHIMFTPARNLVNRIARQSLFAIGDSCWHCHAGIGAFPLKVAVDYKIPLLIWGESVSEMSGRSTFGNPVIKFDRDYFLKVSAKVSAQELVGENLNNIELKPFVPPEAEIIEKLGVVGLHLGDYLFWDDERQMEFVRDEYGWKESKVEGTYKNYKSVECKMAGVHDYSKFLKRGFGRATDHASADIRAGLLTREQAFSLILEHDGKRPDALDFYLEITGFTEEEFENVISKFRGELKLKSMSEEEFATQLADYRAAILKTKNK
jgi:N-acetyl sugar amidotransferase